MKLWALAGVLAMAAATMAPAQESAGYEADGVIGFAAAQAPEAGTGVCFADLDSEAMECAVQQCVEQSGLDRAFCRPQASCSPAQWSADLFIQSEAGPHWHEFLCGWDSLERLQAAVGVKCGRAGLVECSVVRTWDPEGEEMAAEN